MKKQIAILGCLLVLLNGYSKSQTIHQNSPLLDIRTTGTALDLGDEGVSSRITLPFNFQLFGNTFNSLWVGNNGIISFNSPDIRSYFSQAIKRNLNQKYNYTLFPLWTDLVNISERNPYVKLQPDTAIFGWYNAREFLNSYAKNSFEVQLWSNNTFQFRYESINLPRQPLSIGYTGDISSGEYVQWLRHPGGVFLANNISYSSDPSNQCNINPLSSTSCENYSKSLLEQQCNINPLYSTNCKNYQQAFFNLQCRISTNYSPRCPGFVQAQDNTNSIQNTTIALNVPSNISPVRLGESNIKSEDKIPEPVQISSNQTEIKELNPLAIAQASVRLADSNNKPAQNNNTVSNIVSVEIPNTVDLAAFQRVSSQFNAYTNTILRDAQFYPPREVYRNQQTVDNRGAQRVLGGAQENRWQELVDLQFRRGD